MMAVLLPALLTTRPPQPRLLLTTLPRRPAPQTAIMPCRLLLVPMRLSKLLTAPPYEVRTRSPLI